MIQSERLIFCFQAFLLYFTLSKAVVERILFEAFWTEKSLEVIQDEAFQDSITKKAVTNFIFLNLDKNLDFHRNIVFYLYCTAILFLSW